MNVIYMLMSLVHISEMEFKSKVHNDKENIGVNVLMMKCNSKVHSDKEDIGIGVFMDIYIILSLNLSHNLDIHMIIVFFLMMHFHGA